MNPAAGDSSESGPVQVTDIDAEFLPLVYDIVKCVERDPGDAAAKNKESLEAAAKIQELNRKLNKAKELVRRLPGIDYNPEEQEAYLKSLKRQLQLKKELVQKYKSLGSAAAFFNLERSSTLNGCTSD